VPSYVFCHNCVHQDGTDVIYEFGVKHTANIISPSAVFVGLLTTKELTLLQEYMNALFIYVNAIFYIFNN
jgi:hypothetical protein